MLWAFVVLLVLLWLVGLITNFTLGGLIHVLLVLAIASVLIRLLEGRRSV